MQLRKKHAYFEPQDDSDWLSDLLDGEVPARDRAEAIGHLCRDEAARERWALYHGIGDVMRGTPMLSARFNESMQARLAAEPIILAPRLRRYGPPAMMALAASVAVVSVIALMPNLTGSQTRGLQLASSASPAVQRVEVQMAPYMVAHQEFAPVTVVSPYQRAVMTVDEPAK